MSSPVRNRAARVGVVIGTTREGRFADHPAKWLLDIASQRDDFEAQAVDLRDYALPFFDEPSAPATLAPTHEAAQRLSKRLALLDAYIFVCGEYNRSMPAVLKNALDHCYYELHRKPAAFVAYGGTGGVRVVEHLRLVCIELQMAPIRSAVHIGLDAYIGVAREGKSLADFESLNRGAQAMLDELAWWTRTLQSGRGL